MNIIENIYSALSGIMGNKMRSLLTMFGIVVGISSVIMIVSVGQGYRESMNKDFEEMGLDRFTLSVNRNGKKKVEDIDLLKMDDLETIRKVPGVGYVGASTGGYGVGDALRTLNDEPLYTMIEGSDMEYLLITNTKLVKGRLFSDADNENASEVAIIDEDVALSIFGTTDVVGESLNVEMWGANLHLKIVGITESNDRSRNYSMYGYAQIVVPFTFAQGIFNMNTVDNIEIKVKDVKNMTKTSENVIRIIETKHGNTDTYMIRSISDQMAEIDSIIGIFTLFMGIVAAISLLVGGIGVMNIMLVSVTERTREIGIRKSLGATDWNIQFQFLVEAVIITAIGGIVGIIFGYLGGMAFGFLAGALTGSAITPFISTPIVMLVVGVSALIGIVFGVLPANKAAKLDPIESLRYE